MRNTEFHFILEIPAAEVLGFKLPWHIVGPQSTESLAMLARQPSQSGAKLQLPIAEEMPKLKKNLPTYIPIENTSKYLTVFHLNSGRHEKIIFPK